MNEERACVAEIPTIKTKVRYFYYRLKHSLYMRWHSIYWKVLFSLGLGWAYSKMLCRLNLYRKFPDGRCQYCGVNHG